MIEDFGRQLVLDNFLPHGYCLSWSPSLVWTYIVSDALIFLSYFSMPLAIGYFARRRKGFAHTWLLWMFAGFILACGTTHLMGTIVLWQPLYWLDAALKAITAVISVATAIALWPLIPVALRVPSHAQMRKINDDLQKEVAERRRVEEELRLANEILLKSNLHLQHFAHVAAHDLQTPLRTIAIFARLLQQQLQGQLTEQAQEWMEWIAGATNRMQVLVDDLLAYSRLESQSNPLELIDCQRVFNEVKSNLTERIQERKAEVTCGDLPAVMADRTQMAQMLQNLIENGIKYNRSTPPRVTVTSRRRGSDWVFAVADNGIGIAPQHHERIFEIFRRLHTHSEYPGTGIGLAICQKVIERHGGQLWVESQEGNGSTFHFSLPIQKQIDEARNSVTPNPLLSGEESISPK